MRVGFGSTVLARGVSSGGIDGIGSYTRELGQALIDEDQADINPVRFGSACADEVFVGSNESICLGRFAPRAAIATVTGLPFTGNARFRERIDIFHSTDHLVPRLAGIPLVATVMDAVPLSHPHWINQRLRALKAWLWRRTTRWADHVITISDFSKEQIIEHFGIEGSNISVTPLGVSSRHFARLDDTKRREVLTRYGLPGRFFLFVGTLQPRKNLERVIEAHRSLPESMQTECPLIVVGRAGWQCDELIGTLRHLELAGKARWLQYLSGHEVQALMQSAEALVFPSLYEGFGLPVVEAFANRLPVITSNTTALPEVAGDAALLVDPESAEEIGFSMQRLVEDQELAQTLRERGVERARELSWRACAERTSRIYAEVAG
ncbi:glycosyltransferase family 1 protein [Spiribacter sp. 221]|uniref:glycosyltransferase family 4 protein n=1 Tax=Spiribacter onubensis TaxID=3122420 RepID=UPI00349F0A7D